MSNIKGVIEKTYQGEGKHHPKYGTSYPVSLTVGGNKYGGFSKKTLEQLGAEVGKLAVFDTIQNGDYQNIDFKTLVISAKAPSDAPGVQSSNTGTAAAKGGAWAGERGTKIGHAINNAVQLAIAKKITDLKDIHGLAIDILSLSVKLESQYDKIIEVAKRKLAAGGDVIPANTDANTAPAGKAVPTAAQKAAAAKKAKAEADAKAATEEAARLAAEAETEPAGEAEVEGEGAEPYFDDEIPF